MRNLEFILDSFYTHFGDIELSSITSEDILGFMSEPTGGTKQNTKKLRFTLLSAFFNYIKNSIDPDFQNPCDNPALRKLFRASNSTQFKIKDIEDRKAIIRDPNSGKEAEVAFLPQNVADRLQKYISDNGIGPDDRIFPITYAAARIVVNKAGELVGIHSRPHDLRRHAATYASQSGTLIEIVSKILLRHSSLAIISEAMKTSRSLSHELQQLYKGLDPNRAVIAYCHSARRGSFGYFILRLMGFADVLLYEPSWMEWGSHRYYYPAMPSDRRLSFAAGF